METVNPISKPVINVNHEAQPEDIVDDTTTVTNQDPILRQAPVEISFTETIANATIRYTLNGEEPTLGSPIFTLGTPIVLRENVMGDNTIIKAKHFHLGRSSESAKVELRLFTG